MSGPVLFDLTALRRNRHRALSHLAGHDFLLQMAIDSLCDRLSVIKRTFPTTLVSGAGRLSPMALAPLQTALGCQHLLRTDIAGPVQAISTPEYWPFANVPAHIGVFDLHTANDLPGALIQIRRALQPDGLFLAAMPGGETLAHLRACLMQAELDITGGVSPRLYPMVNRQQMAGLMQRAGFALPVVDSEFVTVDYSSLTRMLHDLRYMGEGNALAARRKNFAPRDLFTRCEQLYRAMHNGALPARFEIIYMIGWGPAQPKSS